MLADPFDEIDAPVEVRDDAYHVTGFSNLASIAAHGFSVDRTGVLGTGAYFDLGNRATGVQPARKRYPGQPLVIFRCRIAMGRVLDMDNDEVRERFREFQRELNRRLGPVTTLELGQGEQMNLFLHQIEQGRAIYDTIKRTFATDGLTRIAVRHQRRIVVVEVENERGMKLLWPPS